MSQSSMTRDVPAGLSRTTRAAATEGSGPRTAAVTPLPSVAERFAQAMRSVATSASVIATRRGARSHGVLIRDFIVAADHPPTLLVSLPEASATASAIRASEVFCISVLAAGDAAIAQSFGPHTAAEAGDFTDERWTRLLTDAPALRDSLVSLDCRLGETFVGSGFLVFCGEVLATELWGGERAPLIDHDETFIRL